QDAGAAGARRIRERDLAFAQEAADLARVNGEEQALRVEPLQRVHADDLAAGVEQGSAAVARVDRRVVLHRARTQDLAVADLEVGEGHARDDARRHGRVQICQRHALRIRTGYKLPVEVG